MMDLTKTRQQISEDGRYLSIEWPDERVSRYHAIWLRDNGQDTETRDPINGQKKLTLLDIPEDTCLKSIERIADQTLAMTFSPDEKTTWFDLNWLKQNQYDTPPTASASLVDENTILWDSELQDKVPTLSLNTAQQDDTQLLEWLSSVESLGVGIMTALSEKDGALLDAIDLFGYVRETNYGKYFEVRSEVNPINLAYTGLGLQVHSDNPYRDPVPTLQVLACRENTVEGGKSTVVDSFQGATILKQESPTHFDLLNQYNARFEFSGSDTTHLQSRRPMIETGPDGRLIAVRFNNRSCNALLDIPFDIMPEYYAAYRHFAEILERPELRVTFRINANELFIVDNTRVLHGRTAFSSQGKRWLQGAYADKDGLASTIRVLQRKLDRN